MDVKSHCLANYKNLPFISRDNLRGLHQVIKQGGSFLPYAPFLKHLYGYTIFSSSFNSEELPVVDVANPAAPTPNRTSVGGSGRNTQVLDTLAPFTKEQNKYISDFYQFAMKKAAQRAAQNNHREQTDLYQDFALDQLMRAAQNFDPAKYPGQGGFAGYFSNLLSRALQHAAEDIFSKIKSRRNADSLNAPVGGKSAEGDLAGELMDLLADVSEDNLAKVSDKDLKEDIMGVVSKLDEIDEDIIKLHYGLGDRANKDVVIGVYEGRNKVGERTIKAGPYSLAEVAEIIGQNPGSIRRSHGRILEELSEIGKKHGLEAYASSARLLSKFVASWARGINLLSSYEPVYFQATSDYAPFISKGDLVVTTPAEYTNYITVRPLKSSAKILFSKTRRTESGSYVSSSDSLFDVFRLVNRAFVSSYVVESSESDSLLKYNFSHEGDDIYNVCFPSGERVNLFRAELPLWMSSELGFSNKEFFKSLASEEIDNFTYDFTSSKIIYAQPRQRISTNRIGAEGEELHSSDISSVQEGDYSFQDSGSSIAHRWHDRSEGVRNPIYSNEWMEAGIAGFKN